MRSTLRESFLVKPQTGSRSHHPRRSFETNQLRINNLFDIDPFDDNFGAFLRPWKIESVAKAPNIKIDLTEHDDNYAVEAEIPGVRKEDIDVRIRQPDHDQCRGEEGQGREEGRPRAAL